MWSPTQRLPDPAIRTLAPEFEKYHLASADVERLATDSRWDEETGATSVYRSPSNHANGNTRDRQGRLITCEHRSRRVTRTEYDGRITVLLDRFDGKPLNSPNDVVVKSDGSIWFTDPPFGTIGYSRAKPRARNCPPTSTASTPSPARRAWWPAMSTDRTAWPFRPTKNSST